MLILWVLAATVILVIGAIVVDVGLWLTERRKAQLAADFAALAAATELKPGGDPVAKGLEFADRNGFKHSPPDGVVVNVTTPYNGDSHMVEVTIKQGAPLLFAGLDFLSVGALDIGARAVGTDPAQEVDVVIDFDRSKQIQGADKLPQDVLNAKNGAKAALEVLDPATQQVALGVMWASDLSSYDSGCSFDDGSWVPVRLTDDYTSLNAGIDCLGLSEQGTNWEASIDAAILELRGGPNPRKAIILLADGFANQPGSNPCQSAVNKANQAKAEGIEIYTIGYAIETDKCQFDSGEDFAKVLADMATDSDDNFSHCTSPSDVINENSDGDHFFCQHRFEDLAPIFRQIAGELARDYRLEE